MIAMSNATRISCLALLLCAAAVIAKGASPATRPASDDHYDWAKWREFWSFKPIRKVTPPQVKDAKWVRNEIDAFVLAKLEQNNLKPPPEVDKYTLIRRAT